MFNIFNNQEKIINNFFNSNTEEVLAIEFNNTPKYGQYEYKYSIGNNACEVSIGEEKSLKLTSNSKTKNIDKDIYKEILNYREKLVSQKIEQTISKLSNLTPKLNDGEDKAFEWFRVSSEVLINALKSVDHIDTILQYKLYWGEIQENFRARLLIYNLDIEIVLMDEGLLLTVFNDKSGAKAKDPEQRFLYSGIYNDVFNRFIEIIKVIKETSSKLEN